MTTTSGRTSAHLLVLGAFGAHVLVVLAWLTLGLVAALAEDPSGWQRLLLDLAADPTTSPAWLSDLARALLRPTSPEDEHTAHLALDYAFSAVNLSLGVLLVTLRPKDVVALLLAFGLVGTAAAFFLSAHRALDVVTNLALTDLDVVHVLLLHVLGGMAYTYALLLFPDGRLLQRGHQ